MIIKRPLHTVLLPACFYRHKVDKLTAEVLHFKKGGKVPAYAIREIFLSFDPTERVSPKTKEMREHLRGKYFTQATALLKAIERIKKNDASARKEVKDLLKDLRENPEKFKNAKPITITHLPALLFEELVVPRWTRRTAKADTILVIVSDWAKANGLTGVLDVRKTVAAIKRHWQNATARERVWVKRLNREPRGRELLKREAPQLLVEAKSALK